MMAKEVTQAEVDVLYEQLYREAEAGGYHLNPDVQFSKELVNGLIVNERRYGYRSCPCRLASGAKDEDLDIVCPCDYRDADVAEFNACYCALYVSDAAVKGKEKIGSIPERRPPAKVRADKKTVVTAEISTAGQIKLPLPVWRCKVCGYLCARDMPPDLCPVCKAKKERFERFI
jgi:ferredoxin-thioredoxin reductase catalytic subunit/rubredoxin